MILKVDIEHDSKESVNLKFKGAKLKNKRGFFSGTISPFLRFYKLMSGSETDCGKVIVYQSELAKKTVIPMY